MRSLVEDSAIGRLFGAATDTFFSSVWPNGHRHLFARDLQARLPELFAADALRSLEGLWAAKPPILAAQGVDAIERPQISWNLSVHEAKLLYSYGIAVQAFSVDHLVPAVDRLLGAMASELGFPRELFVATVFVSPPGRGLDKHFDDRDVWLIGLGGTKQVSVAPNHDVEHPSEVYMTSARASQVVAYHLHDFPRAMPADTETFDVSPGDCLFMPRGYWHMTGSSSGPSWSMSIGVRRPNRVELLAKALQRLLVKDARWREPVRSMRSAQEMGTEGLDALFVDLARRAGELRATDLLPPTQADADASRFVITDGASLELVRGQDGCQALVRSAQGEVELDIDAEYVSVVETVADSREGTSAAELAKRFPQLSGPELGAVLTMLVESGLIRAI
jgi:ribosomal protein L16 Arg81 hydroxylase